MPTRAYIPKYIVLIEDEETLATLIAFKLRARKYRVAIAKNGVDGLALIRAEKPDLVLLDILLPLMNGLQVLEELHRQKFLPDLPVIIISNSGQSVEIDRALKFGIRDYLVKVNLNPDEVIDKVQQVFQIEKKQKRAAPASDAHPSEELASFSTPSPLPPPAPSILIVEDDITLVGLLQKKLSHYGYEMLTASSVGDARRILEEKKIDCVLLDIILPDIDGFTFLTELKKHPVWKKIPVIIISNLGQNEEIAKGKALGAIDYIIKANVLPSDILKKIENVLKNNRKEH